jgi:hypothetical protein
MLYVCTGIRGVRVPFGNDEVQQESLSRRAFSPLYVIIVSLSTMMMIGRKIGMDKN